MTNYHVMIVSDGTGETAQRMLKAAMVQYGEDIFITRHANIREERQIENLIARVPGENVLILHTFASPDLRRSIEKLAAARKAHTIDLLGPLMDKLSGIFQKPPVAVPGLLHRVDEDYFARMDAIEYTIRHDNNSTLKELGAADIVLVGVSRTSKTPLSIFLAQEGWKVANIPVVKGSKLPRQLFKIDQRKIVGLSVDSKRLMEIRRTRLQWKSDKESHYAEEDYIDSELEYALSIFEKSDWPVIDVTGKSMEELSQEVLDVLFGQDRSL